MEGETPKFSLGREKNLEIYSSSPSFYALLMKSYENKTDLLLQRETKRHLSSFSKSHRKKKNLSPAKKKSRDASVPKGQFAQLLMKRFVLRNDFDKQHAEEFLSSKEQAFVFPSRNDDIIDDD